MKVRTLFLIFSDFLMYKYLISGAIGAGILYIVTVVLTSLASINYMISVGFGFEISAIVNFVLLDRWVFIKSERKDKPIYRFMKYSMFSLFGLGINELTLILLTTIGNIHYTIAEGLAILVTFLFNYTINKKITWKI